MNLNLYAVYDIVSENVAVLGTSTTDGAFIRQNLPYIEKINGNYLNDYVIKKIGEFDDSTCILKPCEPINIDWSSYSVPEKVSEK